MSLAPTVEAWSASAWLVELPKRLSAGQPRFSTSNLSRSKPKGRNRRSHFQSPSNEKYKYLTDDMRQSLLSRLYELATEDIGFSYRLFDSDSKFLHLSCKERQNRTEHYLNRSVRGSKMARDYTNINDGLEHVV